MRPNRRVYWDIVLVLVTALAVLGYINLVFAPPECRGMDVPRYCVD